MLFSIGDRQPRAKLFFRATGSLGTDTPPSPPAGCSTGGTSDLAFLLCIFLADGGLFGEKLFGSDCEDCGPANLCPEATTDWGEASPLDSPAPRDGERICMSGFDQRRVRVVGEPAGELAGELFGDAGQESFMGRATCK